MPDRHGECFERRRKGRAVAVSDDRFGRNTLRRRRE
jgi:hypothetical protein